MGIGEKLIQTAALTSEMKQNLSLTTFRPPVQKLPRDAQRLHASLHLENNTNSLTRLMTQSAGGFPDFECVWEPQVETSDAAHAPSSGAPPEEEAWSRHLPKLTSDAVPMGIMMGPELN